MMDAVSPAQQHHMHTPVDDYDGPDARRASWLAAARLPLCIPMLPRLRRLVSPLH